MDVLTPQQRSYCMSRIRGRNTKPELFLRKELWAMGLRYRIHHGLPGKPDVVFPKFKLVVFIDGCFWHGCSAHGASPKTNQEFWKKKLSRNMERDRKVSVQLQEMGWTVMRFWEHDVEQDAPKILWMIKDHIKNHSGIP